MRTALALIAGLTAGAAGAQTLSLPGNAVLAVERHDDPASLALPIGPYAAGAVPALPLEGALTTRVWRIEAAGLSTLDVLAPLRAQVEAEGFEIVYSCETDACGGFDFRYHVAVVPPPEMHVDLGDFRYLALRRERDGVAEFAALLVSRSLRAGFVQLLSLGPPGSAAPEARAGAPALTPARPALPVGEIGAALETEGHAILSDLSFETGSAQLGPGEFASLRGLAEYLAANPGRRIALVGHTDSEGSLDGNIALSRRRAGSVLERLVSDYGVARGQMEAAGMGYLAPVAPNTTAEGREANRRVEAIIVSTE